MPRPDVLRCRQPGQPCVVALVISKHEVVDAVVGHPSPRTEVINLGVASAEPQ